MELRGNMQNQHQDLRDAAQEAIATYMYNHLADAIRCNTDILPTVKESADTVLLQADRVLNRMFLCLNFNRSINTERKA